MASFSVIIPAAGNSTRYHKPTNKLLDLLDNLPVIAHAVSAFLKREDVKQIVIVTNLVEPICTSLLSDPRIVYTPGGASRAASVMNGLKLVPESIDGQPIDFVAIHDGARPLISQELIDLTFKCALEHNAAAVPALPVFLTIKQATGPLPCIVEKTVPRQNLWAMQTPQFCPRQQLLDAFKHCPWPLDQITDDVQLLELANKMVYLCQGEEANLKITTSLDMQLAKILLSNAKSKGLHDPNLI